MYFSRMITFCGLLAVLRFAQLAVKSGIFMSWFMSFLFIQLSLE